MRANRIERDREKGANSIKHPRFIEKAFDFLWMIDIFITQHACIFSHLHKDNRKKWKRLVHPSDTVSDCEEEERIMLRLTTSPFSLSLPHQPSSFPGPSLYLPFPASSTLQSTSLRLHTPQPLSSSLSSSSPSSVEQTASFSQVLPLSLALMNYDCLLRLHFHYWKNWNPLFIGIAKCVGLNVMTQMQQDSLSYSRAYWVTESVIAWNVDDGNGFCYLLASKNASLTIANCKIQGFQFSNTSF